MATSKDKEKKVKILKKIKEKLVQTTNKPKLAEEKEEELKDKLEDLEDKEKKEISKELDNVETSAETEEVKETDNIVDENSKKIMDILKDAKVELTKEVKDELVPMFKELVNDIINATVETQIEQTEDEILDTEIDNTMQDIEQNVTDLGEELKKQNEVNENLMEENKKLKGRLGRMLERGFVRSRNLDRDNMSERRFPRRTLRRKLLGESDIIRKPEIRKFVSPERKIRFSNLEQRKEMLENKNKDSRRVALMPSRKQRLLERIQTRRNILNRHKNLRNVNTSKINAEVETMQRSKLLENARKINDQKQQTTQTNENENAMNKKFLRLAGLSE